MGTLLKEESLSERNESRGTSIRPMLCGLWLVSLFISASTYTVLNDQFDRVSRARQIARYGELPFRDFFDPGYFMTEFVSAGLQLLMGDNLLGEWLLDSVFIATGVTLVASLAWRVAHSVVSVLLAALLSLLAFPRGYDFDKVFLYPLGVMLCWRYVDSPTVARTWVLAVGIVVSAVFRYDTGIYIAAAAGAAMLVVHAGEWHLLRRRLGLLAVAVIGLSWPVLVFLHSISSIGDAAEQMLTYARRESAGTRIRTPMRFSLTHPISQEQLPPLSRRVSVRWAPAVDDITRGVVEARHTLVNGSLRGEPSERTWDYAIGDSSASRLRSLVQDPLVEDTSGIDRERFMLPSKAWWIRAQRALPLLRLRVFAGSWHAGNADAFLYYLLHLLPVAAALVLVLHTRSPSPVTRSEMANVFSLIVLCIALNLLILRHPMSARVGGMAGPAAILSVWLAHHAWNVHGEIRRRALRVVTAVVLALAIWSVSESVDWPRRLSPVIAGPGHLLHFVRELAASPPDPDLLGGREVGEIIRYVRECTRPTDRILATWFVPEVYFFSQRAFAAGLATVFAGHWSELRYQERSVQRLAERPAAIIIHQTDDGDFRRDYPLLDRYIHESYRRSGATDFSGGQSEGGGFTVFVQHGRTQISTHAATGLPCFGE
jgi:hypothetical protein